MKKPAGPLQLSLLDQFDKNLSRQDRLVDNLIDMIKMCKYYRTCTRFAYMPESKVDNLTFIMQGLARIAYEVAKDLPSYKGRGIMYFMKYTTDNVYVNMAEPKSIDEVKEQYMVAQSKIKTILMTNKEIISPSINYVNLILKTLDQLCYSK